MGGVEDAAAGEGDFGDDATDRDEVGGAGGGEVTGGEGGAGETAETDAEGGGGGEILGFGFGKWGGVALGELGEGHLEEGETEVGVF